MAGARTWKSFDWSAMKRLHEKGLISDPASKAKSVVLTDTGLRQGEPVSTKPQHRLSVTLPAASLGLRESGQQTGLLDPGRAEPSRVTGIPMPAGARPEC